MAELYLVRTDWSIIQVLYLKVNSNNNYAFGVYMLIYFNVVFELTAKSLCPLIITDYYADNKMNGI